MHVTADVDKSAEMTRQGLGALCIGAVLLILGFAVGGDGAGQVLRAAGGLAALLGFAVLAIALLRKRI